MHLPYVINNHDHHLADVLNDLLPSNAVHGLNVRAVDLVSEGAERLTSFRSLAVSAT
jgi:hypothetical protein